jgi:ABC-type antimicrobial peptide transport system ATPase subunit
MRLFADDTSIFLIVDNAIESADILNRDLNTLTSWSNKWLVSFNSRKTETMVILRKINKPHHPSLIMNNQKLEDVKFHKHLGVTISDDGSWNKHIELVIDKAYSID